MLKTITHLIGWIAGLIITYILLVMYVIHPMPSAEGSTSAFLTDVGAQYGECLCKSDAHCIIAYENFSKAASMIERNKFTGDKYSQMNVLRASVIAGEGRCKWYVPARW